MDDVVYQITQIAIKDFQACQHPTELVRYLHWIFCATPTTIVEVGVEAGGTAWATRQICPNAHMILVDMNVPRHLEEIKKSKGKTDFFQGKSNEMAATVRALYNPDNSVAFIDADHNYAAVVEDTKLYPAKYQVYHDIYWMAGNNAPQGHGADRFYAEHRDCCFIHEFSAGWASIGVRMPSMCKKGV